jgi:hypothetical protein
LSAVIVPGAHVVACFPAVADAQVSLWLLALLLLLAFLLLLLSLLLLGGIPPVAGFHTDYGVPCRCWPLCCTDIHDVPVSGDALYHTVANVLAV